MNRRDFLDRSGRFSLGALAGVNVPFSRFLPAGLLPLSLTEASSETIIPGKAGLVVLNERPINAETPAHLLDDEITPASKMFVRNNGFVFFWNNCL